MATSDEKAHRFFKEVACVSARFLVWAYYKATQGKDFHGSLDITTWLNNAPLDSDGNITGLHFDKIEADEATQSIAEFLAWMEEDLGGGETRLDRLSRLVDPIDYSKFILVSR